MSYSIIFIICFVGILCMWEVLGGQYEMYTRYRTIKKLNKAKGLQRTKGLIVFPSMPFMKEHNIEKAIDGLTMITSKHRKNGPFLYIENIYSDYSKKEIRSVIRRGQLGKVKMGVVILFVVFILEVLLFDLSKADDISVLILFITLLLAAFYITIMSIPVIRHLFTKRSGAMTSYEMSKDPNRYRFDVANAEHNYVQAWNYYNVNDIVANSYRYSIFRKRFLCLIECCFTIHYAYEVLRNGVNMTYILLIVCFVYCIGKHVKQEHIYWTVDRIKEKSL